MSATLKPNDLEAFWMPFTPQKGFKQKPRMIVSADGMYYKTDDGRTVLDGSAGLWCVNAGHNHPKIVEAVQKQAAELDYVSAFQFSHPLAFRAASALCAEMPGDIDHVFFSNSGSEAVDTALKIAIAYWRAKGKGTKVKLIGRQRSYNGVGFGGISVGGIGYNRKVFGQSLLGNTDHLSTTYNHEKQAYSKGQPEWGAHLADELEGLIALHDAENIAAVIVEPVAGSTGVLPPPKGYLEKLRTLCDKHDILMIMDEVITGWGRVGHASMSEALGIVPDIITSAKGINNGSVPMGASFVRKGIYDAMASGPEHVIQFMHGYTYSGHPLACAAALACLDVYKGEGLFERSQKLAPVFEEALHSLKGEPHVVDIRNMGMMGAVELDLGDRKADEMSRAMEVFDRMYFEENISIRFTGPTLAFSPPLIVDEDQITQIVEGVRKILRNTK